MKKPNRIETIFVMIDSFIGSAASFLSDMSVTSIEGMQILSEGASFAIAHRTLRSANRRYALRSVVQHGFKKVPPPQSPFLVGGDHPIPAHPSWRTRHHSPPASTILQTKSLVRAPHFGPSIGGIEHGKHSGPLGTLPNLGRAGQQQGLATA